jgi:UTP--glucose-1-phosphate uridylyltransferase
MTNAHALKTVVFPVAGKGTRFRPATLATPKELLPLVAKPLLQFAIEEAVMAGAEKLIFVSSELKPGIAAYLSHPGVTADCDVVVVNQEKALGLGHAVLCAREHVQDDSFGVILPDDQIFGPVGCLAQMAAARGESNANMIAVEPVAREDTNRYGIIDPANHRGRLVKAKGIVEKPMPQDAPSELAVVGRYILDAGIFERLADQSAGSGGEIQLTDALARDIERQGLEGYRFNGQRYDCGTPSGMLDATIAFARASGDLCQSLERSLSYAA